MLASKLISNDLKINLVGLDELIGYEGPGEDVSSFRQLNMREDEMPLVVRMEQNRARLVEHLLEYQTEFDSKSIRHSVLHKISNQRVNRKDDVFKMIRVGVEEGNDLEKIERSSRSECLRELRMLKNTYQLVSKASNCKYKKTLSRICQCFPLITCSYLPFAVKPPVSFYQMECISKNYPKVMMHSAFAYLIPNISDEYCSLLKKAHMLHQFEFHLTMSGVHRTNTTIIRETKLISIINSYTQTAINKSHFEFDTQIAFLKEYNLIFMKVDKITVGNEVLRAAKLWEQLEKKYIS
ncbi:uncharacterized protein LOC112679240 [Sipha flava]|jgi:hypothetical protein|uniref:Nucleoprotein n=1 Tax=Sipha flava TaxID=143950 RepID=A0A2S2Q965_9HEMI|nr:uncharacterized protein LOC112679240 [Sipha flava]